MGDGNAWPRIRAQLIDADILIISTPAWTGQPSSVCQRVLERLDGDRRGHAAHLARLLRSQNYPPAK
jgi:multimeric flavodoxin WrbA